MGTERTSLLQTKVGWLSRGKLLTRLYEIKDEVQKFLKLKQIDLRGILPNSEGIAKLKYFSFHLSTK